MQDIHPEISFVGKDKSRIYKFLRKLDTLFIQSSNTTITLSEEMKLALTSRNRSFKDSIVVANNFVEEFSVTNCTFDFIEKDKEDKRVIYIFSGNVGKFQRVVEVVQSFLELKDFDGVLYILGDGDELPNVKKLLCDHNNKKRVRLLGRKPFEEANQIAAQCDYGVVSLNPEITKYAYPSKFGTYLSMGLKVFAFVDQSSQIAAEINEYRLGDVISQNNPLNIAVSHTEKLATIDRVRIKSIAKELFGKELLVNRNYQVIENIR